MPHSEPEAELALVGHFHAMAHVLSTWPRYAAWQSMAYWFARTPGAFRRSMCSDWNRGNLVLPQDDPGVNKVKAQQEQMRENLVPAMKICDQDVLERLREAFETMSKNRDMFWPEVYESRRLAAFRKVFSGIARHIATGRALPFLDPGKSRSSSMVYAPGTDPLRCRVTSCGQPAFVVKGRWNNPDHEEAVCSQNSHHRGPVVRHREIKNALGRSAPTCAYCSSATTFGGSFPVRAVAFFHACEAGCPEPTILTHAHNPALRFSLLEEGRLHEQWARFAEKNGWPNPGSLIVDQVDRHDPAQTEIELELERVDQAIDSMDVRQLMGAKGHRAQRDTMRLRWLILDDMENEVYRAPQYYTDWVVKHLRLSPSVAEGRVRAAMKIFKKKGLRQVESRLVGMQKRRAYLRPIIEADRQAGRVESVPHYAKVLQANEAGLNWDNAKQNARRIIREYDKDRSLAGKPA